MEKLLLFFIGKSNEKSHKWRKNTLKKKKLCIWRKAEKEIVLISYFLIWKALVLKTRCPLKKVEIKSFKLSFFCLGIKSDESVSLCSALLVWTFWERRKIGIRQQNVLFSLYPFFPWKKINKRKSYKRTYKKKHFEYFKPKLFNDTTISTLLSPTFRFNKPGGKEC